MGTFQFSTREQIKQESEERDGREEKEKKMEIFTGTNTNKRFEKVCGENGMENETETDIIET